MTLPTSTATRVSAGTVEDQRASWTPGGRSAAFLRDTFATGYDVSYWSGRITKGTHPQPDRRPVRRLDRAPGRFGGHTTAEAVERLDRDALRPDRDSAGQAYRVDQIDTGPATYPALLVRFAQAPSSSGASQWPGRAMSAARGTVVIDVRSLRRPRSRLRRRRNRRPSWHGLPGPTPRTAGRRSRPLRARA